MQPLVLWPRAGAFGAGAVLVLCAQLLWCEFHDLKNINNKNEWAMNQQLHRAGSWHLGQWFESPNARVTSPGIE